MRFIGVWVGAFSRIRRRVELRVPEAEFTFSGGGFRAWPSPMKAV